MAVRITGLTPLLQVFDMQTSLAFYCDILGFELVASAGPPDDIGWVLLRRDKTELMLNTVYEKPDRPPAPDPARLAAHSDTVIYFGCSDIDAVYTELSLKGLKIQKPTVAPYGMKQLYVLDPDGYNLCFQWPVTKETREQWRAWYGIDASMEGSLCP
jgi:glyoxylase I family protein